MTTTDLNLALVVVNFGSSALLAQNLVSSSAAHHRVVVVDNWTSEAERENVARLGRAHGWLLELPERNLGFGEGMNRGVARALADGAQALLLLNPDARLHPADVDRLGAQAVANPRLLLAPRIVAADGSPWMSTVMDLWLRDGTVASSRRRPPGAATMEWVSGAAMALSASLWREIEGFDPDYFLYWEDIDLCRRVHDVGGTVGVDESVVAVHDEGGTHADGGGRAKSETYYVYNIRNRALYAVKWLDRADRRRWFRHIPRSAMDTLLKGGRRQFVESIRPWRAYVRGVLAAYGVALRARGEQSPRPTRSLRVLESFAEPSELTNPYITQLRDALAATPRIEVLCWDWRSALLGGYDVFHTHWTEALIEKRGRASTIARRALFAAFLVRLWLTRTPVVRTVHNLDVPTGLSRTEEVLLRATDRLTRVRVVLNSFTPRSAGVPNVLIEHGHYRDWYASYAKPDPVPARVAFIGKVRRYKNVEGLVAAFRELGEYGKPASLHISGRPSSPELRSTLEASAAADPRITLALSFVDDADLVREVSESTIVALPYHEMHNSGSVLAALSLDRPVLVPRNQFNEELAHEVGRGWVLMFDGDLTAADLARALETAAAGDRAPRPDLSRREWASAGTRHRDAFLTALRRRTARHGDRPEPGA